MARESETSDPRIGAERVRVGSTVTDSARGSIASREKAGYARIPAGQSSPAGSISFFRPRLPFRPPIESLTQRSIDRSNRNSIRIAIRTIQKGSNALESIATVAYRSRLMLGQFQLTATPWPTYDPDFATETSSLFVRRAYIRVGRKPMRGTEFENSNARSRLMSWTREIDTPATSRGLRETISSE